MSFNGLSDRGFGHIHLHLLLALACLLPCLSLGMGMCVYIHVSKINFGFPVSLKSKDRPVTNSQIFLLVSGQRPMISETTMTNSV